MMRAELVNQIWNPPMPRLTIHIFMLPLFMLLTSCAGHPPLALNEGSHSAQDVAEDLKTFIEFVKTTHPDIGYTANSFDIDTMADQITRSLDEKMTTQEAWGALARMNPVFKDAHVGLRRPAAKIANYQKTGGKLFPGKVMIDDAGSIRLVGSELESLGIQHGDELLAINGVKASRIFESLEPRMRGNSEALGRLIMERYFPQLFWALFGGYNEYVIKVRSDENVRKLTLPTSEHLVGSEEVPFTFKTLNKNTAYLEVATFDLSEKGHFQSFLTDAFAKISAKNVDTIIIDLRKNGGGAHDVSDLLMSYLTNKPYSAISAVTARITPENIDRIPGAKLGAVVKLPFQQMITPPEELPNRFSGDVYVLIGGLTYSQAIAFSSTLQDYELAKIAGEETEGPANQTGQVQSLILPNTGFEVLAPIYIFTRTSGDLSNRGVIPDIAIKNDPLHPDETITLLLETLQKQAE